MGGKGSGGNRIGAGRKSKDAAAVWLSGNAGKRTRASASAPSIAPVSVEMPSDLPELHQDVWQRLAPKALAQLTLTPATVDAFRDLVEAIVVRDGLLAAIHQSGYMDKDGKHPLLTDWRGVRQQVQTAMKEFRLAPLGKPMAEGPKPEADPFDEFQAGSVQ